MVVYATDAEGPLVLNDNAHELYTDFVGPGFPVLSMWVVYRFKVENDPNYKAGDTLRVIVPFLKAHGLSNDKMEKFAKETMKFVPGAKQTLDHVSGNGIPSAIISASYEPYVRALCNVTGFPFDDAYCTALDIDKYLITRHDGILLREYAREIAKMKVPSWPDGAKSLAVFEEADAEIVERINDIVTDVLNMEVGRAIEEIDPVGGPGKAEALKEYLGKNGAGLADTVYFGDSITDVAAFEEIRKEGGLAVSFNGNEPPIENADVAVVSYDTCPSSAIVDAFNAKGKSGVIDMAREWDDVVSQGCLGDFGVSEGISSEIYESYITETGIPLVALLDDSNRRHIIPISKVMREAVRGQAGSLI